MSQRASKRRKLDSGAPQLLEGRSAGAKLAELRRLREVGRAANGAAQEEQEQDSVAKVSGRRGKGEAGPAEHEEEGPVEGANGTHGKPGGAEVTRKSAGKSIGDSVSAETGRKRSRKSGIVQIESEGQTEQSSTMMNGEETHDGDLEREDAPPAAPESKEGSVDLESRRTSGRKRQISKKLEEAQLAATPARSPLAAKAKTTQSQQTPTGSASKGRATPGSAPRSARGSAVKKKVLPAEIPDSEPETEPKTNAKTKVKKALRNGVATELQVDQPAVGELQAIETRDETEAAPPEPVKQRATPKKQAPKQLNGVAVSDDFTTPKANKRVGKVAESTATGPLVAEDEDEEMTDVIPDGDTAFEEDELQRAKVAVMRRLARKPPLGHPGPYHPLVGLDAEYQKVASLIEQTVTAGESNSMVLIGARGSGKTALVDNIIREHQVKYADDFHVVRLNGFVHTDDKIAIREIWRQLGREMDIEDDSLVKNYADTLTTLLALLSHPSETGQNIDGRMAKSVIIILDEFDLFTHHPRQTLLYNLFDIAQSRKAPIAVLGLTTRFDVAEALEKRVKSRFSHRQTYLPLARTFASFKAMCQAHLTLPSSSAWNKLITSLFATSVPLNNLLQQTYHTTKSVPFFLTGMLISISSLPSSGTFASIGKHIDTSLSLAPSLDPPDSLLAVLPSLSTLQLSLLIAAARLVIIHDTDTIGFPLAYDEYKSLASKARIAASASGALATGQGARVWGVRVARMAWEGLVEKGLVVEDGGRGGGRVDVSLEEIGGVVESGVLEGVGQGVGRWCKEI
ncbi:Origin recognition complex subunit 4-like protein [Elsinoe fawcettii]|nr:Origin recognition complex subunit 4-like protein [Elsinoe fawcettii]